MALNGFTAAKYIGRGAAIVSAVPFTFSAWVNVPTIGITQIVIDNADATDANGWTLYINSSNFIVANSKVSGTAVTSVTSTAVTANTWYHVCGVWASAILRTSYLNGGGAVANTTSNTPGSVTNTRIGCSCSATSPNSGTIAWVGMWNIALSAAEVLMLAGGMHPESMHPEALVSCPQLNGNSPEVDLVNATPWALTGAPTLAANPSIYMPRHWFAMPNFTAFSGGTLTSKAGITIANTQTQQPGNTLTTKAGVTIANTRTLQPANILTAKAGITVAKTRSQVPANVLTSKAGITIANTRSQVSSTLTSKAGITIANTRTLSRCSPTVKAGITVAKSMTFSASTVTTSAGISVAKTQTLSRMLLTILAGITNANGGIVAPPLPMLAAIDQLIVLAGGQWHLDSIITLLGTDQLSVVTFTFDQIRASLLSDLINSTLSMDELASSLGLDSISTLSGTDEIQTPLGLDTLGPVPTIITE